MMKSPVYVRYSLIVLFIQLLFLGPGLLQLNCQAEKSARNRASGLRNFWMSISDVTGQTTSRPAMSWQGITGTVTFSIVCTGDRG
jgi:hypothetical protein